MFSLNGGDHLHGERLSAYWTAQLALRGISRAEAAGTLHLSVSALNKRLRGETKLTEDEIHQLCDLLGKEKRV